MANLGKNKDINTTTCDIFMVFDQLMKSLAALLEIASEQQALSQNTFNNPFRSFLSHPSSENTEAMVKHYESIPLFNVHFGGDSPELRENEKMWVSSIQISLDMLERKIFKIISATQHQLLEGKQSLFTIHPKFIYGVSINSFEKYKKALKDKFDCEIPPNFDLFYQFLNFKTVLDILNDKSQKMEISSRLFTLVLNVFDLIPNENFDKTSVQEISSYFKVFFDGLKEYMEQVSRDKPLLFWKVLRRILPLQLFSAFLFSCVDDPIVTTRPLIFPKSRLYIFNETNFSVNGKENERNFSFKNEDMKEGYQAASVIVVYRQRDEENYGFVPFIRLNNSEVYTICGVHVCSEGKIDSYYPLSKHRVFNKWFKFNDEDIITFHVPRLLRHLRNSLEKAVFTIYEKIIEDEDVDEERDSAERTNVEENPTSQGDQSRANQDISGQD